MFGIKNMKIGKKIIIAPAIAVLFLLILALFSNNALKSDKSTLNEIVQVKFELYKKCFENIIVDGDKYNINKKFKLLINNKLNLFHKSVFITK